MSGLRERLPSGDPLRRRAGVAAEYWYIAVPVALLAIAMYTYVAYGDKHQQLAPAPEVAAPAEPTTRVCPDCAEEVRAAAKVCRYCGNRLAERSAPT